MTIGDTVRRSTAQSRDPVGVADVRPDADPAGAGTSFLLACLVVAITTLVVVSFDARLHHWFVIPVTICGALIGMDAVEWARGRLDIFDPQALLGLFGFHFFYVCPILHVMLNSWARYLEPPPDWREALGVMAVLNAIGLVLYRAVLLPRSRLTVWSATRSRLDEPAFFKFGLLAVAAGLVAFAAQVAKFGGIKGYLFTMGYDRIGLVEKARGLGWLVVIGESFPLIIFALVVVKWRRQLRTRPRLVMLLLVGLVALQFLGGGIRGARSNTIWPALLGIIMVHMLLVKISRKALLVCTLIFGIFMYVGGLYKGAGAEVLDIASGERSVEELSTETGRDLPSVILGDLGRADIQALVLYREQQGHSRIGYGITYVGGLAFLVPTTLLPADNRPDTKVSIGTDMLYWPGAWAAGYRSSRIHGLAGEATLNFGATGAVLSFVLLGLVVRGCRRYYRRARLHDDFVPKLLAPTLCIGVLLIHGSDLDNVAWYMVKQVVPFAVVLWLALRTGSQTASGERSRGGGLRQTGRTGTGRG